MKRPVPKRWKRRKAKMHQKAKEQAAIRRKRGQTNAKAA